VLNFNYFPENQLRPVKAVSREIRIVLFCDSNLGPVTPQSDALTTRLLSPPIAISILHVTLATLGPRGRDVPES